MPFSSPLNVDAPFTERIKKPSGVRTSLYQTPALSEARVFGIVLSGVVPPLFLERWRGDRNLGTKEACPNYSKGGEAVWEFQVYDVASVIGTIQCSSAFSRGSPTSSHKTIKNNFKSKDYTGKSLASNGPL